MARGVRAFKVITSDRWQQWQTAHLNSLLFIFTAGGGAPDVYDARHLYAEEELL